MTTMKPLKILFVCTHNRCRSILSEAITNHLSGGKIIARSAGSAPAGEVYPLCLVYLKQAGIPTDDLQSQSWNEFSDFNPDVVVTVCDRAAAEPSPLWMGNQLKMHWGLADPSKIEGPDEHVAKAFKATIAEITERTKKMLQLSLESPSQETSLAALQKLGAQ